MFNRKEFLCKYCKELTCIGCRESLWDKVQRKYLRIMRYICNGTRNKEIKENIYNWDETEEWQDFDEYENGWKCDKSEYEIPELEFESFAEICINGINEVMIVNNLENVKENDEIEIPIGILRYSQKKINPLFRGGLIRKSIYETKENLMKEKVRYGIEIPLIEVCMHENKIWSKDNRRLWCLKEIFDKNEEIKCIFKNVDNNFRRKRRQAIKENKEKDFNWYSVIIDMYAKGEWCEEI